jgi:hypothetical protein
LEDYSMSTYITTRRIVIGGFAVVGLGLAVLAWQFGSPLRQSVRDWAASDVVVERDKATASLRAEQRAHTATKNLLGEEKTKVANAAKAKSDAEAAEKKAKAELVAVEKSRDDAKAAQTKAEAEAKAAKEQVEASKQTPTTGQGPTPPSAPAPSAGPATASTIPANADDAWFLRRAAELYGTK